MRELFQKVVVAPSLDGKSADLTIHGRLASILASMKAFQDYSKALHADFVDDYAQRLEAGVLKGQKEGEDCLCSPRPPEPVGELGALLLLADADDKKPPGVGFHAELSRLGA